MAPKKVRQTEQKQDKLGQKHVPPDWAWSLVRAYLDPSVEPTITARCEDAGISRNTLYEALKRPEFVLRFQGMLEKATMADSHEVRLAHLKKCIAGDLEAIRLWYERYGVGRSTTQILTEPQGEIEELRAILKGDLPRKDRLH